MRIEPTRTPFPFWSVGPLTWMSAALTGFATLLISLVVQLGLPTSGPEFEILPFMLVGLAIYLTIAASYGLLYGFVLSHICRRLYVTPRVKPHLLTVLLAVILTVATKSSLITILSISTVAGSLVAIFVFEQPSNENKQPDRGET